MLTSKKISCLIFSTIVTVSLCKPGNSKLEIPHKCGIKEEKCHINLFHEVFQKNANRGIPELGIPPYDPFKVKDTTISVLGMVDLTMLDGQVEGITNCPFSKYEVDIDNGITTSEALCERVRISGQYKINPGPLIQTLTGAGVSGAGNGAIQIDKMLLKVSVPFKVEKREDGEIYLAPIYAGSEYSTNDIEKITFEADNIKLGNQDVSQQLTTFMNDNWKIINRSFGKVFSDKIMEVYQGYLNIFFNQIPAKEYISDDLTPYIKS